MGEEGPGKGCPRSERVELDVGPEERLKGAVSLVSQAETRCPGWVEEPRGGPPAAARVNCGRGWLGSPPLRPRETWKEEELPASVTDAPTPPQRCPASEVGAAASLPVPGQQGHMLGRVGDLGECTAWPPAGHPSHAVAAQRGLERERRGVFVLASAPSRGGLEGWALWPHAGFSVGAGARGAAWPCAEAGAALHSLQVSASQDALLSAGSGGPYAHLYCCPPPAPGPLRAGGRVLRSLGTS